VEEQGKGNKKRKQKKENEKRGINVESKKRKMERRSTEEICQVFD
jgi:hypothetical protein